MSEKELVARGAECVAGDLILNRTVVGMYRSGQFIMTPDGADELQNTVEVAAVEVPAVRTKPAGRAKPAPKAVEPTPAQHPEPGLPPEDLTNLDDLLDE